MRIFTLLLLLSFSSTSFATNIVDGLKTDKDVENFIQSQSPALANARIAYKDFLYSDGIKQHIADSLGVKLWQKVDFDNNGKTDLLAYINSSGQQYLVAIIDEGAGSFSVHFISKWPFADIYYPVIRKRDNLTMLILYKVCGYCHGKNEGLSGADSLVYKFGSFIEYVRPTFPYGMHKIERIQYSTTPCYSTCPVFEIDINANRKAQYHAISYNDTSGIFSGTVDTARYNKIVALLNYIDFPNLDDDYRVTWADDEACRLVITYDDGKVKNIYDYGEVGTHGLSTAYSLLYALRINQHWKLMAGEK